MFRGFVDVLTQDAAMGWAFNPKDPSEHLVVEVRKHGNVVASGSADIMRADLPKVGAGNGDHAFRIPITPRLPSTEGVVIVACSLHDGEMEIPVTTMEDRLRHKLHEALSARFDGQMAKLCKDTDELAARFSSIEDLIVRADMSSRLAALESRLEAAEVFFVRIDETVRKLSEESKKRRRRFLGIF